MKTCARCKVNQSTAAFAEYRRARDGLQSYCRKCHAAYNVARRERLGTEGRRAEAARTRLRTYGLTLEQYNELLRDQGNVCAICTEIFSRTPDIDHCHETGKVRGLLCRTCNRGIGLLGDDPWLLRSAAAYLAR